MAGTGMLLQRRKMEVITNNITNVETTGYKKDYLVSHTFDDVLLERINDTNVMGQTRLVGPLNFGTQVDQKYTDYTSGSFEQTERNTDLALVGDGFFVLQTPAGERYSRAGAFTVNSRGYLTDQDGNYLMGTNGPVYVGGDDFAVDSQGNVTADGQTVNTLRLVTFADPGVLRKQGDNLYYGAGAQAADTVEVKQGFLENSNVQAAREMVDMITVYRTYETNQKILTMIDETVGKAVNDIGRLR